MKINIENKKSAEKDKGAALYLVVVFTAIAVSLLMYMYSTLSSTAITYITEMTTMQEELYLESAAEMVRAGKTQTEISEMFAEYGWSNVSISIDGSEYLDTEIDEESDVDADSTTDEEVGEDVGGTTDEEATEDTDSTTEDEPEEEVESTPNEYEISLDDGSLILCFTLYDGKYSNYYFTEKVEDDE